MDNILSFLGLNSILGQTSHHPCEEEEVSNQKVIPVMENGFPMVVKGFKGLITLSPFFFSLLTYSEKWVSFLGEGIQFIITLLKCTLAEVGIW